MNHHDRWRAGGADRPHGRQPSEIDAGGAGRHRPRDSASGPRASAHRPSPRGYRRGDRSMRIRGRLPGRVTLTLFLDTSGLLKRYVQEADSGRAIASMEAADALAASACAATEAEIALCRAGIGAAVIRRFGFRLGTPDGGTRWMRTASDEQPRSGCDHALCTLDAIRPRRGGPAAATGWLPHLRRASGHGRAEPGLRGRGAGPRTWTGRQRIVTEPTPPPTSTSTRFCAVA